MKTHTVDGLMKMFPELTMTRKPSCYEDVNTVWPATLLAQYAPELPVTTEENVLPGQDLADEFIIADVPQVFILIRGDGTKYLIDTQGATYARYVARIL